MILSRATYELKPEILGKPVTLVQLCQVMNSGNLLPHKRTAPVVHLKIIFLYLVSISFSFIPNPEHYTEITVLLYFGRKNI